MSEKNRLAENQSLKDNIDELSAFIKWVQEDRVYVLDEEGDWLLLIYYCCRSTALEVNGSLIRIPQDVTFRVLSAKHKFRPGFTINVLGGAQHRLREVSQKEWPMFMDNASKHFETMIRKSRFISCDEFADMMGMK